MEEGAGEERAEFDYSPRQDQEGEKACEGQVGKCAEM